MSCDLTSLDPVVTDFDIHTGNPSSNMNGSWQKIAFLYYFAKATNVGCTIINYSDHKSKEICSS